MFLADINLSTLSFHVSIYTSSNFLSLVFIINQFNSKVKCYDCSFAIGLALSLHFSLVTHQGHTLHALKLREHVHQLVGGIASDFDDKVKGSTGHVL